MTIKADNLKDIGKLKQNAKNVHKCPICGKKIEIGIEMETKAKMNQQQKGLYSHLVLHGNPLHGMLCHIDSHLTVRHISIIESIEISRDSETLQEIMKKWANPF